MVRLGMWVRMMWWAMLVTGIAVALWAVFA